MSQGQQLAVDGDCCGSGCCLIILRNLPEFCAAAGIIDANGAVGPTRHQRFAIQSERCEDRGTLWFLPLTHFFARAGVKNLHGAALPTRDDPLAVWRKSQGSLVIAELLFPGLADFEHLLARIYVEQVNNMKARLGRYDLAVR